MTSHEGKEPYQETTRMIEDVEDSINGERFSETVARWAHTMNREIPEWNRGRSRFLIYYPACPKSLLEQVLVYLTQSAGISREEIKEIDILPTDLKARPVEGFRTLAPIIHETPDRLVMVMVKGFTEHIAKFVSKHNEHGIARAAHDFNQDFGENEELATAFPNRSKPIVVLVHNSDSLGSENTHAALTSAGTADFKDGMSVLGIALPH